MRIALCLSGQTRAYEKCFDSQYINIIKPYNCDIFIHTWLYNGLYPKTPDNLHYCKEYNISNYDKYLNDDYLINSKLFSLYTPKKILVEYPDKDFFINKLSPNDNIKFFNAIMMYYSIYQSNNLKKQYEINYGFKYDIVIRCRFDLFFEHLKLLTDDSLYLAPNENIDRPFNNNMKNILNTVGPKYMPSDQFAHGTSTAMDYYSNIYESYLLNQNIFPQHPEGMISEYLWNSSYIPIINNNIRMKIISK